MKWLRWGFVLIPIVAGLVIASLMVDIPTLTNPIIYMRVDLGTLAAIVLEWRCRFWSRWGWCCGCGRGGGASSV
jgi:hypothetical protein